MYVNFEIIFKKVSTLENSSEISDATEITYPL